MKADDQRSLELLNSLPWSLYALLQGQASVLLKLATWALLPL